MATSSKQCTKCFSDIAAIHLIDGVPDSLLEASVEYDDVVMCISCVKKVFKSL
jgi:hypothetical protein